LLWQFLLCVVVCMFVGMSLVVLCLKSEDHSKQEAERLKKSGKSPNPNVYHIRQTVCSLLHRSRLCDCMCVCVCVWGVTVLLLLLCALFDDV